MNNGHLDDALLQRYFDGELSNGSAVEVGQHLEGCETCRKRHRSLEKLHAFINLAVEDVSEDVDFDTLYGRIESGVQETKQRRTLVSIQSWLESSRLRRPLVLAPIAVAAAAILFFVNQLAPTEEVARDRRGRKRSDRTVLVDNRSPRQPQNSEVVQVDFGVNTGTVFEIALAEGVSTPVVWINDDMDETVGQ